MMEYINDKTNGESPGWKTTTMPLAPVERLYCRLGLPVVTILQIFRNRTTRRIGCATCISPGSCSRTWKKSDLGLGGSANPFWTIFWNNGKGHELRTYTYSGSTSTLKMFTFRNTEKSSYSWFSGLVTGLIIISNLLKPPYRKLMQQQHSNGYSSILCNQHVSNKVEIENVKHVWTICLKGCQQITGNPKRSTRKTTSTPICWQAVRNTWVEQSRFKVISAFTNQDS